MIEIRIHGRGGQGAVMASKILVSAAVLEGKHGSAIPDFTFERRGAPVKAFVKIDDQYIREKTQVYNPEFLIVLDPSIKTAVDYYEGIADNCTLVINYPKPPGDVPEKVKTISYVDANKITIPLFGMPMVNTCMLGAFAKVTGLISLDSIKHGISEIMEGMKDEMLEKNIHAAEVGYKEAVMVEYKGRD